MVNNQRVPAPGNLGAADSANLNGIIFESSSRAAATYTSDALVNQNALGVRLFIVTTSTGSGTLTVTVENQDPASGDWFAIDGATTTAFDDPNDIMMTIYPSIAETSYDSDPQPSYVAVNDHLGHTWRVKAVVATAAVTFSIGAIYLG